VSDLAHTIEHNLECPSDQAFFERKLAYDNIPQESLDRLRKATAALAQGTLEKADRMVAKSDRDATPSRRGHGRHRVVLGIFYLEQDLSGEEPS